MPQIDPALAQELDGRDAAREVAVKLAADTGEYNKAMGQAAEATTGVADALIRVEEKFKRITRIAGTTSIGIGAALTGVAGTAATVASQFDDAFARVEKTTNLVGAELADVNQEIREISTSVPVAADELAYLADISGQLGVESENLGMYAETAAALGVATEISSHQAVVALSQLIGIFGQAEEDVEGLASSLAVLANQTRASEQDILNFSVRVGGVAQTVGATADEMMGIGAAVTGMGLEVEAAGTAIQQVMLDMQESAQQGGDRLERFADVMGVTREEFQSMMAEDPALAFHDLVQSLGAAGDEAGSLLRQLDIREVRATQTMLALASASDELTESMAMSSESFREAEEVHELAEIRFDTLIQQLTVMRQSFSEIWRSLGQGLLPVLQFMVERVTDLMDLFHAIPQPIKTAIGAFAGLAGVLATAAGTLTLIIGSWHGLIAALAYGPRIIAKISEWMSNLTKAAGNAAEATGGLAAQMNKLTPYISEVTSKFMALLQSLTGRGTIFALRETGSAMANLARYGIPVLIKGLGMLLAPLAKLAAAGLIVYGAFEGLRWIWEQITSDAEDASDSLEALADSMDATYEASGAYSDEMERAAKTTKEFADANRDLIQTLQALESEAAQEDIAETIARNLIEGGVAIGEAVDAVEQMLAETGWDDDEIGDFDIESRVTFDSNIEEVEADAERLERTLNSLAEETEQDVGFWDQYFGDTGAFDPRRLFAGVDDDIEQAWSQIMRSISDGMSEDFAGTLAEVLDLRQAIDDLDVPAQWEEDLLSMLEDEILSDIEQIDDELRGAVQEFLQIGDMDEVDLMETLLGDPDLYRRDLEDVRNELQGMGIDLEDISDSDLGEIRDVLREASEEAARGRDETSDLKDEVSELQELWGEAGEPSDDPEQTRFRESFLEAKAAEEGHQRVVNLLQEHIDGLEEAGKAYGDEWNTARQMLDQYGQEMADLELRNIEDEVQARDAADAVAYLERQFRSLGAAMDPATQAMREGIQELQQTLIQDLEQDLRQLLDAKDQINDQIEQQEERHQDAMEDLTEQHHDRLEDLEEQHTDRLEDIREQRDDRLEDAEEDRAERLEDAHDDYLDALDDIKEREKDALEDYSREIAAAFDPQDRLQSQQFISGEAMLRNMEQQSDRLEQFGDELEQLQNMGLDWDTVEALGLDDPRQFGQVERLLKDAVADPSLINELNQEWADRLDIGENIADDTSHVVEEQFDDAREDAKENYEELQEDIRDAHSDTVESIKEDYRDAVEDQKEAHSDAVDDAKEDYKDRQEDMREDHSDTVDELKEDMEELARESGDTLEELIERGLESNIDGIEEVAKELEKALESAADTADASFEELERRIMDGWHSVFRSEREHLDEHPALGTQGAVPQGPGTTDEPDQFQEPEPDPTDHGYSSIGSYDLFDGFLLEPPLRDPDEDETGPGGSATAYPRPGLAEGGIVTDAMVAEVGEGPSDEMVIPLDQRGINFVAQAMEASGMATGSSDSGGGSKSADSDIDPWSDAKAKSDSQLRDLWARVSRITDDGLRDHEDELEKLVGDVDDKFGIAQMLGEDISDETWNEILGIISRGVDDAESELDRIPVDVEDVLGLAKRYGERGADRATTGINERLKDGTNEAAGIVSSYADEITEVVNPLLDVLGFDQIPTPTSSQAGASQTNVQTFAEGGLVHGSGGTDSQWAKVSPFEYVMKPEAVTHYGVGLMDEINSLRFARGGLVNPESMSDAQRFAQGEEGKPYSWGSVGPDAYDCSGLWSAITNVINQRHPYERLFATSSFAGGKPPAGFLPGLGEVSVGVTQGNPGHMSGDIGPLSAEARGGDGVVVGPEARSATDPMYDRHFHLGDGVYMGGAGSAVGLPEMPDLDFDVENVGAKIMRHMQAKVTEWIWENTYTSSVGLTDTEGVSDDQREALQHMARSMMANHDWGDDQWPALDQLVSNESSWNPSAQNPESSAFGLFQFLDDTWENYGGRTVDPAQQIQAGLQYIEDRYGSPQEALEHWEARVPVGGEDVGHWYATGGVTTGPAKVGVGERGREAIVPLESQQGIQALSSALSKALEGIEPARHETHFKVDRVVAHDPNKMARDLQRLEQRKRMGGGI